MKQWKWFSEWCNTSWGWGNRNEHINLSGALRQLKEKHLGKMYPAKKKRAKNILAVQARSLSAIPSWWPNVTDVIYKFWSKKTAIKIWAKSMNGIYWQLALVMIVTAQSYLQVELMTSLTKNGKQNLKYLFIEGHVWYSDIFGGLKMGDPPPHSGPPCSTY